MYRNRFFSDPFFDDVISVLHETPRFVSRTFKGSNVESNDDEYLVQISVPGLIKDDIEIKVVDSILSISHERDEEETFRFTDSFDKEYTLPDDVAVSKISAKVESGVLTVTIPKDKKKPKERVINID